MKKAVSAVMIAVVVAGCNSPKEITKTTRRVVAGKTIPRPAVQTVRGYEIVKEYGLGRRIDPNNPNIMYGPCKMYVVRRSPTWNLRPNTPVSSPTFKKSLPPDYGKLKNELKKYQRLHSDAVYEMHKIKYQLLKNQQAFERLSKKHPKNDLQPNIEKIGEDLGKIKRRMAELEQ